MARAAGDLMEQAAPAYNSAVPILSQLLKAETAEREVRSVAYTTHTFNVARVWQRREMALAFSREKGRVEKNGQDARRRLSQSLPRFLDLCQLNAWLEANCLALWQAIHHGTLLGSIADVRAEDIASLMVTGGHFDGFVEHTKPVSPTCLIHFNSPASPRRFYQRQRQRGADRRATGKTDFATAIAVLAAKHHRKKRSLLATVGPINALDQEKAANKVGQFAEQPLRLDLVILDELGTCGSARPAGCCCFPSVQQALRANQRDRQHQSPLQ